MSLVTVTVNSMWQSVDDNGDFFRYRFLAAGDGLGLDPLGKIYLPKESEDRWRRRVAWGRQWFTNWGDWLQGPKSEFYQERLVPKSVLAELEGLALGDHPRACAFLGSYGWMPPFFEYDTVDRGAVRASVFWETAMYAKRYLWLHSLTTTKIDLLESCLVPTDSGYSVIWPEELRIPWSISWGPAAKKDRALGFVPGDSSEPMLFSLKRHLAAQLWPNLEACSPVIQFDPATQEYEHFFIGAPWEHIWRHVSDRVLEQQAAKRCESPACSKLLKPKRRTKRFCNGSCRKAYFDAKKRGEIE